MDITKRARRRLWLALFGMFSIVGLNSYALIAICANIGEESAYFCHTLFASGFFGCTCMFIMIFIIAGYHGDEKNKLNAEKSKQKEEDSESVNNFLKKSTELMNERHNMLCRGLKALNEADILGKNYPLMSWKEQYEAVMEKWSEVELERKDFLRRCNRLYGTTFKIHEECDSPKGTKNGN